MRITISDSFTCMSASDKHPLRIESTRWQWRLCHRKIVALCSSENEPYSRWRSSVRGMMLVTRAQEILAGHSSVKSVIDITWSVSARTSAQRYVPFWVHCAIEQLTRFYRLQEDFSAKDYPGIYTRVGIHLKWIRAVLELWIWCFVELFWQIHQNFKKKVW